MRCFTTPTSCPSRDFTRLPKSTLMAIPPGSLQVQDAGGLLTVPNSASGSLSPHAKRIAQPDAHHERFTYAHLATRPPACACRSSNSHSHRSGKRLRGGRANLLNDEERRLRRLS